MTNPIILASASERRKKIMTDLGINFEVIIPLVKEIRFQDNPERTAIENSALKNMWCREKHPNRTIITADTVIEFNGHCVEKPKTLDEAYDFFRLFSGKSHLVITGVTFSSGNNRPETITEKSSVIFKTITETDIESYFAKVDPMDKAGAYDIDQCPEIIIDSYEGSRTNIMGLPAKIVKEYCLNLP